jgi:tRNA pseudouridine55 synthase
MSAGSDGLAGAKISGILNIDKPAGLTSHDVVVHVRRLTGQRKIGHAGTLDPMATGVLLLCLGQATRVAEYLLTGRKQYRAVVHLGVSTDTYDAEGAVTGSVDSLDVSYPQITEVLAPFRGEVEQVPPPYSAIRQEGRRLYEQARRGIAVEAPARTVRIDDIKLVVWESPRLTLEITCSPGTYIRSLAHDLGRALGVGGHLAALTRLASGDWHVQDAVKLDDLRAAIEAGDWLHLLHPVDVALQAFERVDLSGEQALRVTHGQAVELESSPQTSLARAYAPGDILVAVLRPSGRQPGFWRPKKVFIDPEDF